MIFLRQIPKIMEAQMILFIYWARNWLWSGTNSIKFYEIYVQVRVRHSDTIRQNRAPKVLLA